MLTFSMKSMDDDRKSKFDEDRKSKFDEDRNSGNFDVGRSAKSGDQGIGLPLHLVPPSI
jgi:hypothetical protein